MRRFANRIEAGRELVPRLAKYKNDKKAIVVGLPRGGMVTAAEVAKGLGLPLSFVIVKKVGAPENPEFAVGAITKGPEIEARENLYNRVQPSVNLKGKVVIVVDDGVATGTTMLTAVRLVKKKGAVKVVVAVPVAPPDSLVEIRREADEVVCAQEDPNLTAVGNYYEQFPQVEDEEVVKIMS